MAAEEAGHELVDTLCDVEVVFRCKEGEEVRLPMWDASCMFSLNAWDSRAVTPGGGGSTKRVELPEVRASALRVAIGWWRRREFMNASSEPLESAGDADALPIPATTPSPLPVAPNSTGLEEWQLSMLSGLSLLQLTEVAAAAYHTRMQDLVDAASTLLEPMLAGQSDDALFAALGIEAPADEAQEVPDGGDGAETPSDAAAGGEGGADVDVDALFAEDAFVDDVSADELAELEAFRVRLERASTHVRGATPPADPPRSHALPRRSAHRPPRSRPPSPPDSARAWRPG